MTQKKDKKGLINIKKTLHSYHFTHKYDKLNLQQSPSKFTWPVCYYQTVTDSGYIIIIRSLVSIFN